MKFRDLNKKYGLSKNRFRELYYYCLQYEEWQDELKHNIDTVGTSTIDDMPKGSNNTNATEKLVIRRSRLLEQCKLLEQTAIETDSELYQYILKAVTTEYINYNYLQTIMNIPCSRNTFYDRRRKFYYLLSKKI